MATRVLEGTRIPRIPLGECTEYTLHKSQQTIFAGIQRKIIDYSEHRLLRYVAEVTDPQQKLVLIALINDYRSGKVAIAWHRGRPACLRVTREQPPTANQA